MEEGFVEVIAAFVADEEASVAMQPGEGTLDDPAVSAELGFRLDAFARDARDDLALFEGGPPVSGVVGFISVELVRALTWWAGRLFDRWDGIDHVQ